MKPLISVIIPTYNRPGALCELLECLYRQTYKHLEIIIINDNGENIDFVSSLYSELNILIIDLKENVKHVVARNEGIRRSSGDYILLCDDDDLLVPKHVETMLEQIAGVDLVYSDAEIVEYETVGKTRIPVNRLLFAYDSDREAMRSFSTFVASGSLYRKAIHDQIGLFDEEVYHYWDWDFYLRVSENYPVKRVPIAGTLYSFATSGGDNLSGSLSDMEPFLKLLSDKHDLGPLPTKNFFLLLEEPGVRNRQAVSKVVWDGEPTISRWANIS
ncbi:glycosyltransferase involved in cell wall biosynthesis [Paenibacillus taihuensis]|uniref:Glycosyltransferase involved in cell wall biosynthesis n=1 Tax=Paenibacillus taihuensis TaxID=1156355 RepID=A0A3D9RKS1_9BACL|nr:glycosyltransferase [Paenibacillus taihuensis]REE80138.1 glycosyltransferase involved in cell wall biosynthesis [Paenibacillus taihuensis]